jgi:hypothetical protein
VCEEVEKGKEYGERFLHSQKAVERPFPVELDYFLVCCDASIGDDVLTSIIAFGWAVPEEKAMKES